MTARFAVDGTLHLAQRRVFVVYGWPIDGRVQAGQLVWSPAGISAPVDAVEWLLHSATAGKQSVALCFAYRDEAELAAWQKVAVEWDILELREPGEPA